VSPRKVRETILAALDGIPDVQREPTPNVVVDGFGVAGIDYIVRYYTRNFLLRDVTDSTVRERIWYALRRANIAIPHPTSEVHVVSRREAPATNDADRLATTARLLRGVDFLAVLPPASLDRLVGLVETRVYGANETVIRQGDAGDELFVVGRGEVSVTVGRDGGSTAEIARLGPGQFFGEMSMMTGEARRATVSALGESDLLVVGRQAFAEVLSMSPELARMVADAVVKRQEHLGEHLAARAARAAAETAEHEAKTNALVDRVRQFLQLR
jgi:CRP-like cAMP-binding protein